MPGFETFGVSTSHKKVDVLEHRTGGTAGFFGTTPITRPSVTWPNTATATTTLNETKCQRLMVALVNLGLIVTT
jgi:hypothetical protein